MVFLLASVLPAAALPADSTPPLRPARATPLSRYDASIREKFLADQAAEAAILTPPASLPATAPQSSSQPESTDGTLVLDPMVVHPGSAGHKPPPPVPRTGAFAPLRNSPGEPFESDTARGARLVRKHLGAFGQALSRLPYFGPAVIAGAIQAETELKRAQDLNGIADSIELATGSGQDPEITRKTRTEYLKLYYSGPRK